MPPQKQKAKQTSLQSESQKGDIYKKREMEIPANLQVRMSLDRLLLNS